MNTNPYSIHVSNTSYTPSGMMTVMINGTMGIKVNKKEKRIFGSYF